MDQTCGTSPTLIRTAPKPIDYCGHAHEARREQETRLEEIEDNLPEGEARALKVAFLEHLQAEEPFVYEQYCTKGLESRLVRDRLHAFKVARLLED